jgi:hypothetical protein
MKTCLTAVVLALAASVVQAQDFHGAMRAYYEEHIAAWAADPVLVEAIRAQNARNAALTQAEIDALDQTWRSEVEAASAPTIATVIENAAAAFLRTRMAEAGGVITEAFVMDAHGLNVAASNVTSDYWQGDEPKFTETFPKGPGAIHLSEVEFDDSSQSYQGQLSVPVVDAATGEVVGALTVGLEAEALF